MSWASTTSRAAGRAPIPRTRSSSAAPRELKLKHAKLTAFGSTRFAKNPVEEDRNVRALVEAGTPVVSIFGKTLGPARRARAGHHRGGEPQAHLRDREVPQGPRQGSDLRRRALLRRLRRQPATTRCARWKPRSSAGADVLCLCDTNGGTLTGPAGGDRRRSAQALRRRASASTRTTIRTWRWPTPWPRWRPAPRTCRAA